MLKTSIDNSICFGLYDAEEKLISFARVVTDKVVFAYLMDFFIFEEDRRHGLGGELLEHMIEHPNLQVRLWFLTTVSAHSLYEKFGFSALSDPDRYRLKRNERCY